MTTQRTLSLQGKKKKKISLWFLTALITQSLRFGLGKGPVGQASIHRQAGDDADSQREANRRPGKFSATPDKGDVCQLLGKSAV